MEQEEGWIRGLLQAWRTLQRVSPSAARVARLQSIFRSSRRIPISCSFFKQDLAASVESMRQVARTCIESIDMTS